MEFDPDAVITNAPKDAVTRARRAIRDAGGRQTKRAIAEAIIAERDAAVAEVAAAVVGPGDPLFDPASMEARIDAVSCDLDTIEHTVNDLAERMPAVTASAEDVEALRQAHGNIVGAVAEANAMLAGRLAQVEQDVTTVGDAVRGMTALTLVGKIAGVMAGVDRIAKRGHNDHFNYDYATVGDVTDAVRKGLAEAGVIILPSRKEVTKAGARTTLHIDYTITDGVDSIVCPWEAEADDRQDKGTNKAYTAALKTFLLHLFLMSTGEDADGQAPVEPRRDERPAAPRAVSGGRSSTTQAARPPAAQQAAPAAVDAETAARRAAIRSAAIDAGLVDGTKQDGSPKLNGDLLAAVINAAAPNHGEALTKPELHAVLSWLNYVRAAFEGPTYAGMHNRGDAGPPYLEAMDVTDAATLEHVLADARIALAPDPDGSNAQPEPGDDGGYPG